MSKILSGTLLLTCLASFSALVTAQSDSFKAGQVIPQFGKIAAVKDYAAIPKGAQFKISFDVAKPAIKGEVNRSLDSVARFINMHAAAGIPLDQINLAVVIHGGAVNDLAKSVANDATSNANADLIHALSKLGVGFYVCGQSAAYYGVQTEDLLPGVTMSLSAMTAHALLQQQGYTLNPF